MDRITQLWRRPLYRVVVASLALTTLLGFAVVPGLHAATVAQARAVCALGNSDGAIQHVIYLQFDNTHYNSDRPNVASDLQQMPHLLNFLTQNGTLLTNDHTVLISHTAGGILSSLTGLYPDRMGQTVSNSYDYYTASGTPNFTSSFKYWTDVVDAANNPLPNMITDGQKNTPAPWVPYTRAGCDVGGVGTANIELENNSTAPSGDMTRVFGVGSPEWNEASTNPHLALTDFVGIALHCAQTQTSKCANNANAKPDPLPDEPGGYNQYQALYGAKYVDPAITGGNTCVSDTAGAAITDPNGNCGFPGFDGMEANRTLGYVEQMQESGVPVTFGYISDAHDFHVPNTTSDSYRSSATGPGEATHNQQLKAYDDAFAAFFQSLAAHHIDRSNTLFVVTVDEGDHFAGGIGTPQPDGTLAYSHTTCTNLSACPTNQIGEVGANMQALLQPDYTPNAVPTFDIHFDDAPTFYVKGQPARTDATVRTLEHNVAALTSLDPYVRDSAGNVQTVNLTQALADPVEEQTLHMVNTDPSRTPTFTMFGNPDFFFQLSNCGGVAECANPGFAWNHGDIQQEIGNTWLGLVGPGIQNLGVNDSIWSDHTDIRPTMLMLLGLKDDYIHDGRALFEVVNDSALPPAVRVNKDFLVGLAQTYKQINAPFGTLDMNTLQLSTVGIESTSPGDATYNAVEDQIASITTARNAVAGQMRSILESATFGGGHDAATDAALATPTSRSLVAQGQALLDRTQALTQQYH